MSLTYFLADETLQYRGRRDLPNHLYRVQHEDSWTKYAHIGSKSPSAFSTNIPFDSSRDLTKERVERHLDWGDKSSLSTSFISAFDSFAEAEQRAKFHSHSAPLRYRQQQVFIAKISTDDLSPAYFVKRGSDIKVPVWIERQSAAARDRNEREDMMWVSLHELRVKAVFDIPWGKGEDKEWLACGTIGRDRIDSVIPYDGTRFYYEDSALEITYGGFVFDWRLGSWKREVKSRYVGFVDEGEDVVFVDEKERQEDVREVMGSESVNVLEVTELFGTVRIGQDA